MCHVNLTELTTEARTLVSLQPRAEQLLWHLATAMIDLRRKLSDLAPLLAESPAYHGDPVLRERWLAVLHEAQIEPPLPAVQARPRAGWDQFRGFDPRLLAILGGGDGDPLAALAGEPS